MRIYFQSHEYALSFVLLLNGFSCFGQSVLLSPTSNQTVTQPSGTTLSVNSLNKTLYVTAAANADISNAVNTALASLGTVCGTVEIERGSYTWTTANVAMLPCQTLKGSGVTVTVNVTASDPFLIIEGPAPSSPPSNSTYTPGSVRDITFVGPSTPTSQGSSTGIQVGSSSSSDTGQLVSFYDIHIRNFGCGLKLAYAFQLAFFGGVIEGNYDGVCFPNIITGLENLNFHGTQILNNIDYGINQNQTGLNVEINLISCSLDYNGENNTSAGGQVQLANGKLSIIGGHLENNVLPMITMPTPGAPNYASINIQGASFNMVDTNTSHSYKAFIYIKGNQPLLEIGHGVSFDSLGAAVTAMAYWSPAVNTNSRLTVEPYSYQYEGAPAGIPAYTGTTPAVYSYPAYNSSGNVTGISSSYPYAE